MVEVIIMKTVRKITVEVPTELIEKAQRAAHISVIHDAEHPCALELPIVKP